jgi:hypothetical protein
VRFVQEFGKLFGAMASFSGADFWNLALFPGQTGKEQKGSLAKTPNLRGNIFSGGVSFAVANALLFHYN